MTLYTTFPHSSFGCCLHLLYSAADSSASAIGLAICGMFVLNMIIIVVVVVVRGRTVHSITSAYGFCSLLQVSM